jgi:anti-sigma factor RsiW
MTHATEGLLQAYLDEEIAGSAAAELREHLDACVACRASLDGLRKADRQASAALALLATGDAPVLQARAALARHRQVQPSTRRWSLSRLGTGSMAKAAMLLLALAGAGAAAIPGSPVRRALENTFALVSQFFNGATPGEAVVTPAGDPAAEPVEVVHSRIGVPPADGRIRVLLHHPAGPVDVTVRLVEGRIAEVEAATLAEGVRFRTGAGRIEVAGLTEGSVTVDIPKGTERATIEVDGLVYVYKQGGALQLSGPAGRNRGDQVRFRMGT